MNDIERARETRERLAWAASDKRTRDLATRIVAGLPRGFTWPERFTALMLAMFALADTLKIERSVIVQVITQLAGHVPELEVEHLLELLDG